MKFIIDFIRINHFRKFLKLLARFKRADHIFMIVMAILIGIMGGYGAILFRKMIEYFNYLFFKSGDVNVAYIKTLPWYMILILPAIGGLIIGPIIHFFVNETKGQGISEVMESIIVRGGAIRPRVIIGKIITAAITIGSGGSVGREGPIVQIGSAAGSALGQLVKVRGSQLRTLVACGAAAGTAATFNAPLAGSILALEILLGNFAISHFSPIVISSVTATVVSRYYLGNYPAFEVPGYDLLSILEFIPYSILGILAGFVAIGFIKTIYLSEDLFAKINIPVWLKPALGGLMIGAIGIFFPYVLGVGYESMGMAVMSKYTWSFLLLLVFLKIIATSITVGSGSSGGVFAPALFLGASLGGFVGEITHIIIPSVSATSGAYALVGMGAMAAAVMNAPITAILMLFELTNDYRIILPMMTAIIIGVIIKTQFQKDSIYDIKLKRKGLKLKKEYAPNILSDLKTDKILKTNCIKVLPETSFEELFNLTKQSFHLNYFVVDENSRLIGMLSPYNIRTLARSINDDNEILNKTAADLIVDKKTFFTKDDTLDMVVLTLNNMYLDEIPIVDNSESMKVIGYISKTEVIQAYNREVTKKDMLNSVSTYMDSASKFRKLRMLDGEILSEVDVPGTFVGKNLFELDLRKKYGIEVILIKQNYDRNANEPDKVFVPSPDYKFDYGDKLLIVGDEKDVDSFNEL